LAPKAAQGNTPPPNSFLTTSCTTSMHPAFSSVFTQRVSALS
jgi:hypothetical protein